MFAVPTVPVVSLPELEEESRRQALLDGHLCCEGGSCMD